MPRPGPVGFAMTLLLGVVLAGASALVSQIGFLLRHRGAVAAADVDIRRPLHSAVDLFRQKWWTIGYALAVVAYLLHVGALGLAALSVVQAVLAGGVVMLAVIAERYFGFHLGRRQWLGVVLSTVGLVLLAGTAEAPSGEGTADYSFAAIIAFESGLVALGAALILSCRARRLNSQLGVLLGAAAGVLFTVTHVAVKAISGDADSGMLSMLASPYLPVVVGGGVAAFFASARSLQIGPAVPVIAITSIAGNASSIPAGIVVFGDPLGDDALSIALRSLAFVMVIVAAALIPAPTRAAEAVGKERARLQGRPVTAPS
jgi:drug/metabolite transporter (DMT)-like permease